ncbi:MAG TPA: hypothetical protein VGK63_02730 [Candidatus Limnocylindrales bacterium]
MTQPDPGFERKLLYSVVEVASITGRPPGLVKRWIYRGQLECVRIDDESPFVPFDALVERLERLAWKRRRREAMRAAAAAGREEEARQDEARQETAAEA